jgi:tyrosine aminotransferase
LRSLFDEKTKALLVNNPSNPCGTCFSKKHQLEIFEVANEFKVPIIADEVYYGLVYEDDAEFISMGNLQKEVPVICTGAISKIYALPGWRLGWTIVYNNNGYFDKVIDNLHKHAMIQLHPNSLIQAALPRILKEVTDADLSSMKSKLQGTSRHAFEKLNGIRGLKPIRANAAMYMMVNIDLSEFRDIKNDVDFC